MTVLKWDHNVRKKGESLRGTRVRTGGKTDQRGNKRWKEPWRSKAIKTVVIMLSLFI